ncbi:MAG TPA: IS110 family transposase [Parafilimonas sp.]|jgi:transposase|nr:IS110 family transposase [Parafilimonas sp.]
MKVQHIIGADLSKRTIDLFFQSHHQIENNKIGFSQMMKWIKQHNITASEVMIVMEHTGLYSYCFEHFLHEHHIAFCKVNPYAVKRSMGLVRGKSDKIDARRLANYGFKERQTLTIEPVAGKELQRLQLLFTTRERLVKHKAALLNAVSEYRNIGLAASDLIMTTHTRVIKSFEKEIERLQGEMDAIVQGNPSIKQNQCLLQSIKGVGKVLSIATIIKTRNFTRFQNARKFACFCGTAPFEHTSGSSIRGKTKVSQLADKTMKTLLDLSAKSAIQYDKELKDYYLRRTESGKSKMSTINIVRNKILYRMFAVVKRQTPYVENYLQTA